ncbi:hypothetical protein MMC27_006941 [Xylographa pallens]|nr:hypothetical protein [Xylographa pallens]
MEDGFDPESAGLGHKSRPAKANTASDPRPVPGSTWYRGGAANIESPWAAGAHNGTAHDVEVIPEQALRRESQVDTHTGRGGAANVRHASSSAPVAAASGPPSQDITPIEQQNHHVGRGGEGNVQHSGEKHESALDTLKHMVFSKK